MTDAEPTKREPGSDELLSPEAAIMIQDGIWEDEKTEEIDSVEFRQWYQDHMNEWTTEEEDVEPTAQS
jgi:hypothetical protein